MKRIFAAIDISDETRRQAGDYIADLRAEFSYVRAGWDKLEKMHLTLKFLGEVDDIQIQNLIAAAVETAKQFSDFNLRISKTGAFPSEKNARVLWLGVPDESGNLRKLNEIFEIESEKRGFAKEKRSFKPHLTIARLREPRQSAALVEKHLRNEFESNEFTVSGITIYESQLQKTGSIYSIVSISNFDVPDVRRSA